ncbi:MAG: hypothetical protein LBP59_20120 [Planctomycetaceae bacterium]|jgi:hypothetical protein|nr:hypothetical protein [Planctomycetaceae bacterium]
MFGNLIFMSCLFVTIVGTSDADEQSPFVELKSSYLIPNNSFMEFKHIWDNFDHYYDIDKKKEPLKLLMPNNCPIPITQDGIWLEVSHRYYVMYNDDDKPDYFLREFHLTTNYINKKLMFTHSRYVNILYRTTVACTMAIDQTLCSITFDKSKKLLRLTLSNIPEKKTRWLQWNNQGQLENDETVPLFSKPKFTFRENK